MANDVRYPRPFLFVVYGTGYYYRPWSAIGPFDVLGTFGQRAKGDSGKAPRLTFGPHLTKERFQTRPRARLPLYDPGGFSGLPARRAEPCGESPDAQQNEEAPHRWPRPRERTGAPSGCPTPW